MPASPNTQLSDPNIDNETSSAVITIFTDTSSVIEYASCTPACNVASYGDDEKRTEQLVTVDSLVPGARYNFSLWNLTDADNRTWSANDVAFQSISFCTGK